MPYAPQVGAVIPDKGTQYTSFGADIDLSQKTVGIRPGTTGNIVVQFWDGVNSNVTLTAVQLGEMIPGNFKKIVSSGTTITDCVVFESVAPRDKG